MDRETLRRVQLAQLEILKEIRRVCDENGIRYFLCCGTFLGAVRHQGFIPWDDDLDIGMLRADYEAFCRIAPEKLDPGFCLQNWYTDPAYPLPFGKVRMRNTLYVEAKSEQLRENGIYVDVFPFDFAPEDTQAQASHAKRLCGLFRTRLMCCRWRPWMDNDRINWVKRLGYVWYQLRAVCSSGEKISLAYDSLAMGIPAGRVLCRQRGFSWLDCYEAAWYQDLALYDFEGERFPGPRDCHRVLTAQFGDYMTLPPEDQRENRHQIIRVEFFSQ